MDISEVTPGLYIASKFYPFDEQMPHRAVVIDCTTLSDDDSDQSAYIDQLAKVGQLMRTLNLNVVLVCDAGRNRSAVIAARVLILQGKAPVIAIEMVRAARAHLRGGALTNAAFLEHLAPT